MQLIGKQVHNADNAKITFLFYSIQKNKNALLLSVDYGVDNDDVNDDNDDANNSYDKKVVVTSA